MESGPEPFFNWIIRSTSWMEVRVSLPLTLVSYLLTALILYRGKGVITGIGLIFIVLLPAFLGILSTVISASRMLQVISHSQISPRASEWGDAISVALFPAFLGMIVTMPCYLCATSILIWRSLCASVDDHVIEIIK